MDKMPPKQQDKSCTVASPLETAFELFLGALSHRSQGHVVLDYIVIPRLTAASASQP